MFSSRVYIRETYGITNFGRVKDHCEQYETQTLYMPIPSQGKKQHFDAKLKWIKIWLEDLILKAQSHELMYTESSLLTPKWGFMLFEKSKNTNFKEVKYSLPLYRFNLRVV